MGIYCQSTKFWSICFPPPHLDPCNVINCGISFGQLSKSKSSCIYLYVFCSARLPLNNSAKGYLNGNRFVGQEIICMRLMLVFRSACIHTKFIFGCVRVSVSCSLVCVKMCVALVQPFFQ